MLTIENIMSKPVYTISPDKTIADIAKIMKAKSISCCVIAEKGNPVGIITEKDIVRQVVAANLKPSSVKLRDIMTTKLISADVNTDIFTISKTMDTNNIRRMLILKDGKLAGIITTKDILKLTSI